VAGFNACRNIVIENVRNVLKALEAKKWSNTALFENRVNVFEMAGAAFSSDLGLPMDAPSSLLLRSVAMKCGSVCALFCMYVAESPSLTAALKEKGKLIRRRVATSHALIETAITLEGCLLLEKTCVVLGNLCRSFKSWDDRSKALLEGIKASVDQVSRGSRLVEAGSLGRAAVLPLQRVPHIVSHMDESFDAFCASSYEISQVEQALVRVTALNGDLSTFLQPVVNKIGLNPSDTVFSRLLVMKGAVQLVQEKNVAELVKAGGGARAELTGLGKLAVAAISTLVKAALESGPHNSAAVTSVCNRVDVGLVGLLEALAQPNPKTAELFLAQQGVWNEVLDVCKPLSVVPVRTAGKLAFSSLANLWGSCSETVSFKKKYFNLTDRLKDALLEVQIGVVKDEAYLNLTWVADCAAFRKAISNKDLDRASLFNACFAFAEQIEEVASKGGASDGAGLVRCGIQLIKSAGAVDVSLFEMGFGRESVGVIEQFVEIERLFRKVCVFVSGASGASLEVSIPKAGTGQTGPASRKLVAELVVNMRGLYKFVSRVVTQQSWRGDDKLASGVAKNVEALFRGLYDCSADQDLIDELAETCGAFFNDLYNAELAQEVLSSVAALRDHVLDLDSLNECKKTLVGQFGVSPASAAAADGGAPELDPVANTAELAKSLESAFAELSWDACTHPLLIPSKMLEVFKLVGGMVDALRNSLEGSIRRSYAPYAAIHSAATGKCVVIQNFASHSERVMVFADALSLLCEGLENLGGQQVGMRGMMMVRDAVAGYAEAEEQTVAGFDKAAKAIAVALTNVPKVKDDYVKISTLVDVGHELQVMLVTLSDLLLDLNNLLLREAFSKSRIRIVALLQEFLRMLKKQGDKSRTSGASISRSSSSGMVSPKRPSSPQHSPRAPIIPQDPKPASPRSMSPKQSPRAVEGGSHSPRPSSPRISPRALMAEEESVPPAKSPLPIAKEEEPKAVPAPEEKKKEEGSGAVRRCKAIFKFNAKSEKELSFQRGDTILVDSSVDMSTPGMWKGSVEGGNGEVLLFNSKYVKPMVE
jgi:hypothetical protein